MSITLVDKDIPRICGGLLTKTRGTTISLKDDDIRSDHRQDSNLQSSLQPTHQKLSLIITLSNCCSDCGDVQSHYVVSVFSFLARLPNHRFLLLQRLGKSY
jgi:hypothetical protein